MLKFKVGERIYHTGFKCKGEIVHIDKDDNNLYALAPYLVCFDAGMTDGWLMSVNKDNTMRLPQSLYDTYKDATAYTFWWASEEDLEHLDEKGAQPMEKFNVNDKVRIVYDDDSVMGGVEGVIVWIRHFGEKVSYLLRIDAERYKKEDVGWNLESSDDCFPASIRERYADNPYYKFWLVNDTEIVHVEDEDTEYHDTHYKACIVEPILVMCAVFPSEQFKGFLRGNALKYRLRAGHKEDAKADIDKALRYEQWLKEYEETGEITL